jgi:cyclopropane-fatty-acyl-phospholipid synthase
MTRENVEVNAELDVEAAYHYETSNDFFKLWLDPTMTYSCAYFATGSESLEEAQMAKVDRAFQWVNLQHGDRLLDIGCGWGAAAERAAAQYGASAVGLTLSHEQVDLARRRERPGLALAYRLEGWETYRDPCDVIVSFGAFEHFKVAKYDAFFSRCHELLPDGGFMLIQTITIGKPSTSFKLFRYAHFLRKEIYPGAELPPPEVVVSHARLGGFELVQAESLRPHYVRTLEEWLRNLEANREAAIAATSEETYRKNVRYLKGAAQYHHSGETNVYHFLFRSV